MWHLCREPKLSLQQGFEEFLLPLLPPELIQRPLGHPRPLQPRGQPGINARLHDGLLNLRLRHPVSHRPLDVHRELRALPQRDQHGEVEEGPRPPVETRPAPDQAPARLGCQLLHRPRKVRRVGP